MLGSAVMDLGTRLIRGRRPDKRAMRASSSVMGSSFGGGGEVVGADSTTSTRRAIASGVDQRSLALRT